MHDCVISIGNWINVKSYYNKGNWMKKIQKTTKVSVWHLCLHKHILAITFWDWLIMLNKHILLTSLNQLVVCDEFEMYCIIITTISRLGDNFQGGFVRYNPLFCLKWYDIYNPNVSEIAQYTRALKKITFNSKFSLV